MKIKNLIAMRTPDFCLQILDFCLQRLILHHFPLQKVRGQPGLRPHPIWREQIGILQLVRVPTEVLHLHPALPHQRLKAIVQPTQADAQLLGHLALCDIRVVLQQAQDFQVLFGTRHGVIRG